MRKKKYTFENMKLDAMLGPNTNQYWLYDNTNDVFIDPPAEVLNLLDEKYGEGWWINSYLKQAELLKIAETKPDWLFETDYWYSDVEI